MEILTIEVLKKRIDVMPKDYALEYNYLHEDKELIENEIRFTLDWSKLRGRRRIGMIKSININDSQNWSEAINWQVDMAEKFKKVFSPKIKEFFDGK